MSGDVIAMPDRFTEPWEAHEHPGRPLDEGAIICACVACEAAIYAYAERTPGRPMGLATGADRLVVTAEYLAEVMRCDRTLAPLLYVADDYVRRLFVPVNSWWFRRPRRWWSLTCHEDEEAAGRRHPRHRVAKRQSEANRLRQLRSAKASSPDPPPAPVEFTPLATAVEPWRQRHGQMLAELRVWALERGRPVDLDVVALILAAREAGPDDAPLGLWARTGVNRCLSVDTFNWCSLGQVLYPDGVPGTFWLFLEFLADGGRLERASDPLDELHKPLVCYGGLDRSGREPTDDDYDDDRSSVRCECQVRYRGPTHGELTDLASAGALLLSHAHPLAE
ncbi:MAG: hypothetical protein ACRDZN_03875 [Acidimicrobiales bacterium]